MSFLFFFFFQAEDGIRDTSVTGVQTCALPIWMSLVGIRPLVHSDSIRGALQMSISLTAPVRETTRRVRRQFAIAGGAWLRSEERRVGKECRCGWAECHEK